MKRRVGSGICHREPGLVRTGTEGTAENGLGAAHRSTELHFTDGRGRKWKVTTLCQGCDGFTRYRDRLSMNHFSSVADKAHVVRHGRIWGGNTKLMLSSLKRNFQRGGLFL